MNPAPYGYDRNGNPLPEAPLQPVYPELWASGVRAVYALLTKAIPSLAMGMESTAAGQAAYANAARNSLKDLGRGPLAPVLEGWRQPGFSEIMVKKGQDAYAVIESAGKSNTAWNGGAAGAAVGALIASPPVPRGDCPRNGK
jgi:hypothetical protein